MNYYEFEHKSDCPHGGLKDTYRIVLSSCGMVTVESIQKILAETPTTIYQEVLADYLRNKTGMTVKVTGTHHGIKITSIRK
jgi:hypothetical protein